MNNQKSNNSNVFKRTFFIIGIIVLPVILTAFLFMPFIFHKKDQIYIKPYRLVQDFQKNDISTVISHMAEDGEFVFYFALIPPATIEKAVEEVYGLLADHRNSDQHYQLVKSSQERVNSLAILFNNFSFPGSFTENPEKYPQLARSLWTFLFEEFKLTVIAVIYKATYDPSFSLKWTQPAQNAAKRLQSLILKMPAEKRQYLMQAANQAQP